MPTAVSVISSKLERPSSGMGSVQVGNAQLDGNAGGSYKKRYEVFTASAASPISVIVGAQAIGSGNDQVDQLWEPYSYKGDTDPYSYCKRIDVDGDPACDTRYLVTCTFEPAADGEIPEGDTTPGESVSNPLLRPPKIWWDREVFTDLVTRDKAGKVIATPVNALHEDYIEHPRTRAILCVDWNIGTFAAFSKLHQDYENAVNGPSPWLILGRTDISARTALVRQISCSKVKNEGEHIYYTASMRFAFAETGKTWSDDMPLMSRAYFTKGSGGQYDLEEGSTTFRKRTLASEMVPINEDGTRRADDQAILYQTVQVQREANFNSLPFMALIT